MNYFRHDKALVGDGAVVGRGTRIWAFTNVEDGAVIGQNCNICDGCFIEKGVIIGNDVTIKNHVSIFDGVTIEDDVFIGTNTSFINDRHPKSHNGKEWVLEKTVVHKGSSIGSNATILCGITISPYAFIGAGSVVTKDVARHALVFGNPARAEGYVCQCGRKLDLNLKCSCGLQYALGDQGIHADE